MLKKESTKEKIIDTFWELYEIKHIHKITVTEICKIAQINRSTFYVHFLDVYDVLDTIENCIFPSHEITPSFNSNTKHTIFDIGEHLLLIKEKRKYLKVIFSENKNSTFRIKFINYIRPIILNIINNDTQNQNLDYTLNYTLWGIVGAFEYHINNDNEDGEDLLLNTLIDLIEKTFY